MKKRVLIVVLALAVLLATIGVAVASNSRTAFQTGLGQEAPGVITDAHGNAIVVFEDDGSSLTYKVVVNGLNNTTQAHIHVAPTPGANGPIVLWLYPAAPPSSLIAGIFNGLLGTGSATSANLTGAAGITTLDQLRTAVEEGRAYVNAHTTAFPAGEIRGTLH